MKFQAPGSYRPTNDRVGRFETLARKLLPGTIALVDERVAHLHPKLVPALAAAHTKGFLLHAGEKTKTVAALEDLAARTTSFARGTPIIAVGGGTIGDLATVFAHLFKRGAPLIHVPTTLLAAVDSSLGGKGAVHAGSASKPVKNALGVFHYATERWICAELFETLEPAQRREGLAEAYKMAVCLDAGLWRRYAKRAPALQPMLRDARRLKESVCKKDPYESSGLRRVLNFGHTFGHVIEAVTRFKISHGEAVGLGMLCALDLGRALKITPAKVAASVEEALVSCASIRPRTDLQAIFRKVSDDALSALLDADKKTTATGRPKMVLLRGPGRTTVAEVPPEIWRPVVEAWRS